MQHTYHISLFHSRQQCTRPDITITSPTMKTALRSPTAHYCIDCNASNTPISGGRSRSRSSHRQGSAPVCCDSSRREALLAAVLLGLSACDSQQPAAASPQALAYQQQQQQQQQQQVQLMQRFTGRRPIVVSLADLQTDYDRYARTYDELDGGGTSQALGLPELRRQLLQQATGEVLEVGIGTGLNLPLYSWPSITHLTGVDLSAGMLLQAAARADSIPAVTQTVQLTALTEATTTTADGNNAENSGSSSNSNRPSTVPVSLVQGDVARLPFPDHSFDTVLDTFSLCVFPDPGAAVAEMARLLRPGGRLLLLEHSRSDNPLLGAYQEATRAVVAPISKGCDWGQDVPGLLAQLPQLHISRLQRHLAGTLVSMTAVKDHK